MQFSCKQRLFSSRFHKFLKMAERAWEAEMFSQESERRRNSSRFLLQCTGQIVAHVFWKALVRRVFSCCFRAQ
jgi:hypothetical protein